jgi:hypothetical protein
MARPTEFKTEYTDELFQYFAEGVKTRTDIETYQKPDGEEYEIEVPSSRQPEFPTLAGFAIKIGVNRDTLLEWAKHNKDFEQVYKMAKEFQEHYLVNRGLTAQVNPRFAMFFLINNCGYRTKHAEDSDQVNINIMLADRLAKARARVGK